MRSLFSICLLHTFFDILVGSAVSGAIGVDNRAAIVAGRTRLQFALVDVIWHTIPIRIRHLWAAIQQWDAEFIRALVTAIRNAIAITVR